MIRLRCFLASILLLAQVLPCNAVIIDRIAVVVNGDVVTASEISAIRQLNMHLSGLPPEPDIVQERIDHHLVLQQIVKQPPQTIPPEQVQEVIDTFVRDHGGTEEFLVFLHSIGMNYQDFETELNEQLTIQTFLALRFRPFVNVTIEEAETYYNEVYVPKLKSEGKLAPPFAACFDQIQALIVESQVQARARKWLDEIRQAATINVKE